MPSRAQRLALLVDRFVRQHAASKYSHALAVLLLALAYLVRHVYGVPPVGRHGGFRQFLATVVAWWPVLVSWRIVKEPIESAPSFIAWLVLFWVLTLAVCAIHVMQWPLPLARHAFLMSVLYLLTLVAIVPLAIEKWSPGSIRVD